MEKSQPRSTKSYQRRGRKEASNRSRAKVKQLLEWFAYETDLRNIVSITGLKAADIAKHLDDVVDEDAADKGTDKETKNVAKDVGQIQSSKPSKQTDSNMPNEDDRRKTTRVSPRKIAEKAVPKASTTKPKLARQSSKRNGENI